MSFGFHHSIDVRFRDCDELGHVNNAVYFTYFEEARWAFFRHLQGRLRERGCDKDVEVPWQPGTILARAECDFCAQARYGDVLDVKMRVGPIGRSSFTCEYEVVDAASQRLIATAKSVQVTYDFEAGRSVPIPEALRAVLEDSLGGRATTGEDGS